MGSHLVRLEQQQRGLVAISADLDGGIQRALDAHARGCGEDELELGNHLSAPGFVTQLRGAQAGLCALGTARRLACRLLAPRLLRPVQRVLRLALKRCGMGGTVEARPFNGRLAGRVERVTVDGLERGAARLWGGGGAVVSTERVTVDGLERGTARLWGGEGAVVSTCMLAGGSRLQRSRARCGAAGALRPRLVISGHQSHQRSSEVISGHQWSSVVSYGHKWPSESSESSVVISGYQRSSEHQW